MAPHAASPAGFLAMEGFRFRHCWATRTLLFSLGVLAGSALIGIIVDLALFAFPRLLRNSTSTLRLMLLKQMRSPAICFRSGHCSWRYRPRHCRSGRVALSSKPATEPLPSA
jgi:hypothetical protein